MERPFKEQDVGSIPSALKGRLFRQVEARGYRSDRRAGGAIAHPRGDRYDRYAALPDARSQRGRSHN